MGISHRSRRFLNHLADNFLVQELNTDTKKGAILDLLLVNREGLVGRVIFGGHLGHSDMKHSSDRGKTASKAFALLMGRADLRLLRKPATRVPWESSFEGIVLGTF